MSKLKQNSLQSNFVKNIVLDSNGRTIGANVRTNFGDFFLTTEELRDVYSSSSPFSNAIVDKNGFVRSKPGYSPIQKVSQDDSCYVLMNKNTKVLKFSRNCEILWSSNSAPLPIGFTDLFSWLNTRFRFLKNGFSEEVLVQLGISGVVDSIDIFNCVSLSDTFWVKRSSSKLTWRDVSPFTNNYSVLFSRYFLDKSLIGGKLTKGRRYLSPDVSTDGSFPHTWKIQDDNNGKKEILFIKAGSKYTLGGINSGMESFSEYFASQLCEFLSFRHVLYKIRTHKRSDGRVDIVTECRCYTSEELGSVSATRLGIYSYESLIDYCKRLGKESYDTCLNTLFLDCLTLNTDRHFSNVEFFVENASQRVIGTVPIFDNNYSLLPRFVEDMEALNLDEYIARDGRSFKDLFTLVSCRRSFKKELISVVKDFKFVAPGGVQLRESRVRFLNEFIKLNAKRLLSWV